MNNQHGIRWSHGKSVALALGTLLVGGIIILWSWNTVAGDLFSLPQMRFKHALAAELLLFAIAATFPIVWRLFGRDRRSLSQD